MIRIIRKLLYLTVFLIAIISLVSCSKPQPTPRVVDGEIDLSNIDFTTSRPISLNGRWQFSCNKILGPQDYNNEKKLQSEVYLNVPSKWNGTRCADQVVTDYGLGTYRLRIKLSKTDTQLTLLTPDTLHSYNLFINGKLIGTKGVVGKDPETAEPLRGNRQISFVAKEKTIELILQTSNFHRPMGGILGKIYLGSPEAITDRLSVKTITDSFLYGSIFLMVIYHIALSVLVSERRSPFFFSLHAGGIFIRGLLGGDVGIMFVHFPSFPWELSWKLGYIGWFIAAAGGVSYFQSLFSKEISTWVTWVMWIGCALYSLFALFGNVYFYESINLGYQVVLLAACIYTIYGVGVAATRKVPGSLMMLSGLFILVMGATHEILMLNEVISSTTEYLSVAVFTFLFIQAVLLAMRFSKTFDTMEHAYTELSKIVYKNVIDRIHKGSKLEETMPTNRADATVITFDIVSSTTIKHPRVGIAIENTMGKCYRLLSKHYDPETLTSNGYRIKETGDGLLCSIGYPFKLPEGAKNHQSKAIELAESFAKFFREEFSLLKYQEDLYCMIAVTSGSIQGYFPISGIKQYDLRGRALALSKRYEEMKEPVFNKHGKQGSLLFIQKSVFESLDNEKQLKFSRWDTTEPNCSIRDDIDAKEAFFRFLPHPKRVDSPANNNA